MNVRSDDEYAEFLTDLDAADVTVTDWEATFIESNMDRAEFTPAQRAEIDRMIAKYGDKI